MKGVVVFDTSPPRYLIEIDAVEFLPRLSLRFLFKVLKSDAASAAVLLEELHGFVELKVKQLTHLPPGKFAGTIPVQSQCFQGAPAGLRPIKAQ